MRLIRVIPTLAVTAACAAVAVPAASASTDVQQASSENWSGYVVGSSSSSSSSSGTRYRSVSGTWTAPTASCTSGDGYSSFWVGLGGAGNSQALEQAGTEADCSGGTARYFAWYELVPSAPVKIPMSVHPGDTISSTVTVNGTAVTISLADRTTGQSFTRTLPMTSPDTSSAEWVAEAPSACSSDLSNCTPMSLANFGKVTFTNASATTTDGHTGTISDARWSTAALTLDPSASDTGSGGAQFASAQRAAAAGPSSLSSDGSSFSVTYAANTSTATDTSVPSGAGGYGYPGGYGYSGGYGYPGDGYGYSYGYPGSGYGYAYPY